MKVISFLEDNVVVEKKKGWTIYNVTTKKKHYVSKKDNPNYAIALTAKWGYIPLKHSVHIDSFKDIDLISIEKLAARSSTF